MDRDQQIEKIQSAVESAEHIPADKKAELLGLLSKLKPEIANASQTNQDHAEKIVRLVEASAHEATRTEQKPDSIRKLVRELEQSAENFEASHPELVALVTEYTALLSALGI
jgi:CRISPR/Cas system CSM-associated protein Csm2 small subunit